LGAQRLVLGKDGLLGLLFLVLLRPRLRLMVLLLLHALWVMALLSVPLVLLLLLGLQE